MSKYLEYKIRASPTTIYKITTNKREISGQKAKS
jgi:hypothetical protein